MFLKECLPHLIHQFPNESDLVKAIQELSQKFTTKRESISDYLNDPRLVAAYTAFYLTTNYPKLNEVFKWLPPQWLEELKTCDFVDLGAGPGTFSLAFRDWRGAATGKVHQIEQSKLMRDQARKLWDGLYPETPMLQSTRSTSLPNSFLLFGHSANEMGPKDALRYINEINPDHILFIEPGTKAFFPQMLEIRRALLNNGFNVLFPCPKALECPMAQSENDWCHQFIHVHHADDVERLSQILKLDRKLLPLTVHAYSRTFKHSDKERIVRVHPATKFSFEWDVCVGEKVDKYQVFRRGLDKKTQKEIDEVLAGASVETETDKVLEGGSRVRPVKINNKTLGP
ncbi:MAG TPA: small ribosomal subunit Rsm22 family protein [Bacteriovoracaceae bacterium]|nr:small ribosomal subunit Rsm22 family protein [Bacteriovoracaceae bacterium]